MEKDVLGTQLKLMGHLLTPPPVEPPQKKKGKLLIESEEWSGKFVEVDAIDCTCETFKAKATCQHVRMVVDIDEKFKKSRYLFKSAFHKELRRQDVPMAAHWSTWFRRAWGDTSALEYMRKIWSEETLNLDLAVRLHGGVKTREGIELFCRSRKFWEFQHVWEALESHFMRFDDGLTPIVQWYSEESLTKACEMGPACFQEMSRRIAATNGEKNEKIRDEMRRVLVNVLEKNGTLTKLEADVFRTRYKSGRFENEDFVLLLLASRQMTPEMREYRDVPVAVADEMVDGSRMMMFRTYVFDYHTVPGKIRLKAWKIENENRPIMLCSPIEPLDLRWAGGLVTLLWRFESFRMAGSIEGQDKMKWTDVGPSPRWDRFKAWYKDFP